MDPAARRELGLAVALCLLGASLVLVAAGRVWTRVEVFASALAPARTAGATGAEVVPGLGALGLVALAGVVALAATRRAGRTAVGLVLLGVGAVVMATALRADGALAAFTNAAQGGGQVSDVVLTTGWPLVAALGGALVVAAGLLVATRGRHWAALSQKYEPASGPDPRTPDPQTPDSQAREPQTPDSQTAEPQSPAAQSQQQAVAERHLWEALDRGEDPTAR